MLGFDEKKAPKKRKASKHGKMVGTQLPEEMFKIIEEKIIGREYVSVSDYLRDLVRRDLKDRGFL